MNAKRKIATVLCDIKENSEINANEKWVEFKLNTLLIGPGILSADEERRILVKLQNEGVIKLHIPHSNTSSYTPEQFMFKFNKILVELLDGFHKKYYLYKFFLSDLNYWNFVNPFWLFWQTLIFIWLVLKWLWSHKIFSIISALVAFLVIDYSLAWCNLKSTLNFLSNLFK